MPIVKPDSVRVDYKLVGVTIRSRVHSYISLYILAKGITKASIFKELIMDWVEKEKLTNSDVDLVEEVIRRTQLQWKLAKFKHPDSTNIVVFKAELKKELEEKCILPHHIETILKELR